MNILVTGANGQLGRELRNAAAGSTHHYIFSDVSSFPGIETLQLDITNREAVRIVSSSERVDAIVNCAAYTDVDGAEMDQAMADLLNHKAAEGLAAVSKDLGITLLHISTDYVFNGRECVPYQETHAADPLGVYGVTKLAGERAIRSSGCRYVIVRTAWLYSPYGKNFVKTIKNLSSEQNSLKVVCDQVGSPTYAADLATFLCFVIEQNMLDREGIYHYSNEGAISWYDFAKAICELSGNDCDILPCTSSEFPTKAQRPHFSVLDKRKLKKTFGVMVPYWRDSLKKCLERMG